ncbi:dipeptidase D [Breznakibacter xylanolyticus]|uniref:Cytosol non-specific dipeptidase n=1 Tax=Breznakibacter xylanolyticus TaxID=990 RepID=A0A2W7NCW6_9BACT|nr:aminoacyl-histidine dipeptidase [Breznakibacter xylanolyticus]PZX10926.1 dipeptidase D [Breznakibacter xylanolyticus]
MSFLQSLQSSSVFSHGDVSVLPVWQYFSEICQIPRPSKHEEKIRQYLLAFANQRGLDAKTDEAGNVLISKPAMPGCEHLPVVVLQSHMDMVCEKNSSSPHRFEHDAITPIIDGEWVKASGTTLGADDGIGMAAQLALLASNNITHAPLQCLFTVDEETGLTGAAALQTGFFSGSSLINLDSEDEGEIFIGCAGGMDTVAVFPLELEPMPQGYFPFEVRISGLKGGHSGDDIHRGLANANKLMARFLFHIQQELGMRLVALEGGNLRNAIPREAYALAVVPMKQKEPVRVAFNLFIHEMEQEFSDVEPGMRFHLESTDLPSQLWPIDMQHRLLRALMAVPHGVIEMSKSMEGLVETSTNLASVKMTEQQVVVTTSQRSSVESAKHYVGAMVESVFVLAGAQVAHSDGYPGWTPNLDSPLLKMARERYQQCFGVQPRVRAIHAGLECGLFLEKFPALDMISFGPTLRGVHSPDERLHIPSVLKFWQFLVNMVH